MARTETDRAYMAGFVDGEGHIGITVLASGNGRGRHALAVNITNTHIPTLERLAQIWDGKVIGFRSRGVDRGWKQAADVRWNSRAAGEMLREVQPYLITKRAQCDVALAFIDGVNPAEHHSRPITEGIWEAREDMRLKLRALNRRGGDEPAQRVLFTVNLPLKCQYCGKAFATYQKRRKYCSRECNMKAGRDAYVDRHTAQKECPACGKQFTARLKQLYCSISCGRKQQAPPVPKGSKRDGPGGRVIAA